MLALIGLGIFVLFVLVLWPLAMAVGPVVALALIGAAWLGLALGFDHVAARWRMFRRSHAVELKWGAGLLAAFAVLAHYAGVAGEVL